MLSTKTFGDELKKREFHFYTGVPCSFLKDVINYALNTCDCVTAANEGDAVAICAGAQLGGAKTVVFMQNSGLGNAVSPLTSLNAIFKIPVLLLVSLRGETGVADEPQHELMGQITTEMLDCMRIKWEFLSADPAKLAEQLDRADAAIRGGSSFCFVVKKGTFDECALQQKAVEPVGNRVKVFRSKEPARPKRAQVLTALSALKDENTALLATTGYTGRELYELGDNPHNFYMVGSMGCVSSVALGLAMAKPDKKVIAIDGDGALIMRMGALPINGAYGPSNLLHVVLNNGAHESTGKQATVAGGVDFVGIAAASGYRKAAYVHDLAELEAAVLEWKRKPELTFLQIDTGLGALEKLGRPKVTPAQVAERFRAFLS